MSSCVKIKNYNKKILYIEKIFLIINFLSIIQFCVCATKNNDETNIINKTINLFDRNNNNTSFITTTTTRTIIDWNLSNHNTNDNNINDINKDLNLKDQYQSSVEIISTEHITQACIDKCPQENFTNTEHTNLGCGEDCYNKQYHLGCSLWELALPISCQIVCNQTDDDLIQLKDVYCTMGCKNALKRYFKWLRNEIKTPPAPALVADTLTATSLSLEWKVPIKLIALTHETYTPNSYLVQWRYEALDEDWKFCKNQSIDYGNSTIFLDGLKPYTKYRFRVSIPLTPNSEEILVSHQSIIISTLAEGVPTSQPIIVRTVAVDHTRISVSWEPGPFPNGPLLSYSLEIKLLSSEGYYSAFKEISASENVSFYIFDKLQPAKNYSIEISMRNAVGEGPKAKRSIETLEAPSLYQNEPEPKLILGTEYSVMFQDADILSGNSNVFYHSEHKLLGIAIHIAKSLLFVSDVTKKVVRTTLGVQGPTKIILTPDSENVNFVPSLLTIDWLNDHLYMLAKLEHSKSQYQISRCNLDGNSLTVAYAGLTSKPSHIQVDPVNGFLYWIIPGYQNIDSGLYKMDLADISNGVKRSTTVLHLLQGEKLGAFVVDFNKFKLLVPTLAKNNIYSVSFDGNSKEEIRNNTQKAQLSVVKSLAMANGIFYWTNGISLFTEDHHEAEDKYYHNSFPIIKNETFISVAVNLPSSQPIPVPVSPPVDIQSLLSSTTAKVTWDIPHPLGHQGKGAWQKWEYMLKVMDNTIVHHSFVNISETQYTVYNLKPDTNYTFIAAAYTSSGYSPYSKEFKAKTLKSSEDRFLFWSSSDGLYQTNIIGENATLLKSFTDLSYGAVTDIEWFEDLLFFVNNTKLTILNRTANDVMNVWYANEVENIGVDWIGRKIYWSYLGLISRSNFDGQNREFILSTNPIKEIRIDSLNGYIYYSTGNSIEACHLNGKDKINYTTFQHSTGYIMGLTLDIENEKIYWVERRYGVQPDLYIANMVNSLNYDRTITQIKLRTKEKVLVRQDLPSNFLTHFSDRLLWMQNNSTVIIGDISGENLAKLNLMHENKLIHLQSISVLDPSHRLYPKGISRKKLNVIPESIDTNSIRIDGLWNAFNISWSPVHTVNYGKIFYEIKVLNKLTNSSIETPNDPLMPYFYYSAGQIMPYTALSINIRAYTYWAASKFTTVDLYSPAAAPSETTKERIFITHSHNPFTGGRNITATLRWNPPERPNGLIKSYTVYGWYKVNGMEKNIRLENIRDQSVVIPNLINNITYYFQIQAFTSVEGGNRTFPIYVNSSIEQPIPKLLIAESNNRIEEFDLDLNSTRLIIHTGYPVNYLSYIDLEKRIIWFDDNNLVSLKGNDRKQVKLATIYNEILSLTVDWIQRTVYWSQSEIENGLKSSIYRLDLNQFEGKPILGEKIHSSSSFIRNLTISPFDQKLFWLEFDNFYGKYGRLVQYDLHESAEMELEDQIKMKCNRTLVIKSLLLDTPSWKENNLVLINVDDQMYMYGLRSKTCNILTKEKYSFNSLKNSVKQIVKDSDNIYIIGNETIIIRSSRYKLKYQVNYNKKISHALAFGYQNYPKMQCLIPKQVHQGTEIPELIKETEHSLTLKLPVLESHTDCPLPLTGIKYTIEYSPFIDTKYRNSTRRKIITAYKPVAEIRNLKSFTKYVIRVSVTNHYAERLGLPMFQSNDITLSTAPGPPSSPRNLEVEPISPTDAMVSWLKPVEMNSESIWYEIHFETESNKHQSPITEDKFIYDTMDPDRISFKLTKLLPSHQYTLWILAYSSNSTYTSSERVEIEMFDEPDNITIKETGSTYMKLHWITPKDVSKYVLECNIKGNSTVMTVFDSNDMSYLNMESEHNYLISGLEPKTTYRFSARLFYSKNEKSYVWPPDDRFFFETLGDRPSSPGKPKIYHLTGSEVIKISWEPAHDNGAFIEEYSLEALPVKSSGKRTRRSTEDTILLEKSNDNYDNDEYIMVNNTDTVIFNSSDDNNISVSQQKNSSGEEKSEQNSDKWFTYCSVTENHCIKHDSKINEYTLRVRARNSYGWGPYSAETEAVNEPYSSPRRNETTLVFAIGIPVFLAGVILISCIVFVHHRCTTPKKILQQANNRFMDLELANLRELPRGGNFFQQRNILYMPHPLTDADIALLPQIRSDQITKSNLLGKGAFGEVYEGIVRSNDNINIRVAVKTLRKGASEHEKYEFLQEAILMSNFKHEHILRLIGVCFDCESLFIIMELMEGGDLLTYLRSSRPQNGAASTLTLFDLISICVDVASGCRYLEEMHFVHRDLACRNCLVSSMDLEERVVKIGDFGLTRDIYKNDYYRKEGEGLLPVRWMSPESLVDGVFTSQSDIWAFGVLCWEIMTLGQQPYPARNNLEVLNYVCDGGLLGRPAGCPKELYQLMLKCWNYRPANRPTFRYCLQVLEGLKKSTNKSHELLFNENTNRLPNGDIFNPSYLGSDFNHNQNIDFEECEKLCSTTSDNCRSLENLETPIILTPASSTLTIIPKYLEILYDENATTIDGNTININQCEPYEIPIPSKELLTVYGTEQSKTIDCPTTYSFTSPITNLKSLTTFNNGNCIFDNTITTPTNLNTTTNGILTECNNNYNINNNSNINTNITNSKRTISNSSTISGGDNSPKFLIKRLSNSSFSNNLINNCNNINNINNSNNNIINNCNENNNLSLLNANQILKVNLPTQINNNNTDNNKINYKKLYKDSIAVNNNITTTTTPISETITTTNNNSNNNNNNNSDDINILDYNKNSKDNIQNEDGRILVSS